MTFDEWCERKKLDPSVIEVARDAWTEGALQNSGRGVFIGKSHDEIAWESETGCYVKYITDDQYMKLRYASQKWYKPYYCSRCELDKKEDIV